MSELTSRSAILNQCAMVHWCAMNDLQECHRSLAEDNLLVQSLRDVSPYTGSVVYLDNCQRLMVCPEPALSQFHIGSHALGALMPQW